MSGRRDETGPEHVGSRFDVNAWRIDPEGSVKE
jgi:hypothetical protein